MITIEREYAQSAEKREELYKRTLRIILFAQMLGGAGLAAGVTVGALLAKDLLGSEGYAGLPSSLFTLGSAVTAYFIGRTTQRYGRRLGLGLGFLIGSIGAIGVIMAVAMNNVWLFFLFLFIYGAGSATNLQSRYAGTDLAPAKKRAFAISVAMVSTTFGAVAGPNLVGPMGRIAEGMNMHPLTGPFMLAAVAYFCAGTVLFLFLRPDPFLVAKEVINHNREQIIETEKNVKKEGVIIGAAIMILSQIIMVAIMTMTPVQMGHHHHNLSSIGMVIGLHIAAMYLPSLGTGLLVDKIGPIKMALASVGTLLLSGLVAGFFSFDGMVVPIVSLLLLGLGWNFGLISGTTLLIDSIPVGQRAKIQGSVDVFVAISGATGGALSGMVVASSSYAVLTIGGGLLSLTLLPIVLWKWSKKEQQSITKTM